MDIIKAVFSTLRFIRAYLIANLQAAMEYRVCFLGANLHNGGQRLVSGCFSGGTTSTRFR